MNTGKAQLVNDLRYEQFSSLVDDEHFDVERVWESWSDQEHLLYIAAQGDFNIFYEIRKELARQIQRWGVQEHEPLLWNAILVEEVGEVGKAILETWFQGRTDADNGAQYCKELIQVAAVAISAVRAFKIAEANPPRVVIE